jgi:hypothetical protein
MKTASCIDYRLILGDGCSAFLAACEIRPPGMVEVQILQEQISVHPSMEIKMKNGDIGRKLRRMKNELVTKSILFTGLALAG